MIADVVQQGACHSVPLAPAWHTGLLVALVVLVAAAGSLLAVSSPPSPAERVASAPALLPALLVQWGLLAYVCRVGRPRSALRPLLGRTWSGARAAATDVLLAAAVFGLIEVTEAVFANGSDVGHRLTLPAAAVVSGAVFAVSTGLCEEVVYRGYLRVQLAALTRSTAAGIVLQGALFGAAHLDQGAARAARIGAYGCLLGALACARRSLWPGITCHVAVDALAVCS